MKFLLLLSWIGIVGLCLSTKAQTPTNRFVLGPAVSVDHFTSRLASSLTYDIRYANSISYGIDLSYLANRFLVDVQLLTAQRRYDLLTNLRPINNNDPVLLSRRRLSSRYYSVPIDLSYRLITNPRLQVFAGVGALIDWMPQAFSKEWFNLLDQPSSRTLPDLITPKTVALGASVQAKARYHLTDRLMVQLEPAFRFFPTVQTPYVSGNKTGLTALLSLGYAFF